MKQKYIIIDLRSLDETEKEVNRLIEEGYKPQGGICVYTIFEDENCYCWYAQAMIRETPEQTRATILTEYYQEKGK